MSLLLSSKMICLSIRDMFFCLPSFIWIISSCIFSRTTDFLNSCLRLLCSFSSSELSENWLISIKSSGWKFWSNPEMGLDWLKLILAASSFRSNIPCSPSSKLFNDWEMLSSLPLFDLSAIVSFEFAPKVTYLDLSNSTGVLIMVSYFILVISNNSNLRK